MVQIGLRGLSDVLNVPGDSRENILVDDTVLLGKVKCLADVALGRGDYKNKSE